MPTRSADSNVIDVDFGDAAVPPVAPRKPMTKEEEESALGLLVVVVVGGVILKKLYDWLS